MTRRITIDSSLRTLGLLDDAMTTASQAAWGMEPESGLREQLEALRKTLESETRGLEEAIGADLNGIAQDPRTYRALRTPEGRMQLVAVQDQKTRDITPQGRTALALLLEQTGDGEYARRRQDQFHREVTRKLPAYGWEMEAAEVAGWVVDHP